MKPSLKAKRSWKQSCLRTLVGTALLSTWMMPSLAAGTEAGTEIPNRAYGSFENPTAPAGTPPTSVQSNEVIITVAEIAGISIIPSPSSPPVEAPANVSGEGPGQGDGTINAQDVVYFTYRIINTGNDETQFFIPDKPSDVDNGIFDADLYGPIEVVGISQDGAAITAVTGTPIAPGGSNTDTLSLPFDGSVDVGGFIEVRVPIKANSGLVSGNVINPVLGNTPDETTQNSPESTLPADNEFAVSDADVITRDNNLTDNGDASALNPDPEREASSRNPATVGNLLLDYGDAPGTDTGSTPAPDNSTLASYETVPGRGPSHIDDGLTFLGTGVDSEPDAFSDPAPEDNGVTLGGSPLQTQSLIAGQTYTLNVTTDTTGRGVLTAWIDYNRDGVFDNATERVTLDNAPTSGALSFDITVPASAADGPTYARFRYSSDTGLNATGPAGDGEVEDYLVNLVSAEPALQLVKRVTNVNGTAISTVVDPTTTTDPQDDSANWPDNYLRGAVNASAEPFQTVEYTIYFLSDGNVNINNVQICDFIPENTTYVPGSLAIELGGTAVSPAITDTSDTDQGESFAVGATPGTAGVPCDGTAGANTDGGVLFQLDNALAPATGPGTPTTSYGFVRFSVTVK